MIGPDKPVKKRKSKKRNRDPEYRPRRKATSTAQKPASTEGLLRLMGVATSPAGKAAVSHTFESPPPFKSQRTQILSPSDFEHSTPNKGHLTSHVKTPGNSRLLPSRTIECDDGDATIFLSEDKSNEKTLTLLEPNDWVKNNSPVPQASLDPKIDIEISKASIEKARKQINDRRQAGGSDRIKSQRDVMKISARDALINAGYEIEPRSAHWIHFMPHEFFADDAQVVDNLGLGLKGPNGAMELMNRALIDILLHPDETLRPEKLYLSAIPKWVAGFENIRLLESLTYTVKNQLGASVSVNFNMLSLADVCVTEVELFKSLMEKKFLNKPALSLEAELFYNSPPLIFSSSSSSSSSSSYGSLSPDQNTSDRIRPSREAMKIKPKTLFTQ